MNPQLGSDETRTSIMRSIVPEVLKGIVPTDSDIVLMLLFASDKVARQNEGPSNSSFFGPYFKGLSKLHKLVESLLEKEQKLKCSYQFKLTAGERKYDEGMWKDILAVVDSGLITEEVSRGVDFEHMGETFRLHKRYRITRLGREYVERYFGKTSVYDSILRFMQTEYRRWEKQRKRVDSVVESAEQLLTTVNTVKEVSRKARLMKKVIERQKQIDELKGKLPFEINYKEDIL
jgi:DNA-binding PadR family transcriptional regulator